MMRERVLKAFEDSAHIKKTVGELSADHIVEVAEEIAGCLNSGGKVLLFGNGGSAADAQHIASELVGRFSGMERKPLPAIALTTDTSAITAIANDFGFDEIFERQVRALGNKGDVAIGITTSGKSRNVTHAIRAAKEMGLKTIALTGRDGGELVGVAGHVINVPSNSTARVQEAHITIGHILCELVEEMVVNASKAGNSGK